MSLLIDSISQNGLDRLPSPNYLADDFLELLKSPDFETRLQTLNRACSIARRDPEWFNRFSKKGELFKCLDRILVDDRWELQHQSIKFLVEAMPTFGNATEYCMCYVMPNLIPKLGSSKITVRRICHQAIISFLRTRPEALQSFMKMLSNYLQSCTEQNVKNDIIQELPSFFVPELSKSDWTNLIDLLTDENVLIREADNNNEETIGTTIKKLNEFIGNDMYVTLLDNLCVEKKEVVEKITENIVLEEPAENNQIGATRNRSSIKLHSGERRLRFGIVPSFVATLISDDQDVSARISGLEKLKTIIEQISAEDVHRLVPHLHSYLLMLANVLSDLNFKVIVLTLDVIRLTVHNLRGHMEAHLQQVVSLVSKHFGNQKSVIKQLIMMTFMDMYQHVNPKSVGASLRVYLENKNSRTREEVVNIITASLMTISPSKFNMTPIINNLVPLFNDPKRRVRLAAFEQLSVVSYLLNGKTEPLLKVVRDAENEQGLNGLMDAVMARLRRQLLPRIRYDGLIEYSTPPVSDCSFAVDEEELYQPENADLVWILNSGGREQDAIDRAGSPISLAGNLAVIRRQRVANQSDLMEAIDAHQQKLVMMRMKSEDNIIRRNGSAASNPVQNWDRPIKKVQKSEDNYEAITRSHPPSAKPRREVNNNIDRKASFALKARSETNLSDDRENNVPQNFDDRPAKASGAYSFQDFDAVSISKKSASHHSLPVTANAPLRHTQSQKRGSYLRSGQGAKSKSIKSREASVINSFSVDSSNVSTALKKIERDEWSEKVDGLQTLATLSQNSHHQISDNLKEIISAVLTECKNLRSSVSRVAIVTIGTIAQNMGNRIDSETDKICSVLLNRAGDVSNAFIREDATEALNKVIRSASPNKALLGIISAGSKSKNNTIRSSCASFVNDLIGIQGSSTVLNNSHTLSNLLSVLVQFSKDQTPQVRQYAKQSLAYLGKDPNFDRLLRKNATESDSRAVKEILSTIDKRGGIDSIDASMSVSGTLSRAGSTRRIQKKLPESVQLDLDEIRADLLASGWERRIGGLQRFEEMCSHASKAVASDTRLIEAFIAKIADLNARVASTAMDTFLSTLRIMCRLYSTESNMKAVLNQLLFALTSHLSSKSEEHRHLAQTCIKEIIKTIDSVSLMSAFTAATKKANVRQRPFIVGQFCELIKLVHKVKPKQVEVSALPILWDSVKTISADAENKKATQLLAKTLAKLFGEKPLLDMASSELDIKKKKQLETLIRD